MNKFQNEVRFHLFQLKQNFNNKRMLKASFAIQVISMCISNSAFFIIWVMFSKTIGTHNGWGPLQTFGMLSVTIFVFGVGHSIFGSIMTWHEKIPTGALDSYLTKPKSLYIRLINNDFNVGALGDLIQGLAGCILFIFLSDASLSSVIMLVLLLVPAIMVEVSFLTICSCVVFWIPQAGNLPMALTNLIMAPATQPVSLLKGPLRFIYLFIIPALVIAGLPVESFTHTSWKIFFLSYGIAIFWFVLSRQILKISLTRYESGNSIGA